MSSHYHVINGMGGGYLPDGSYRVDGLRAARNAMSDDVDNARFDDSEQGYVWERSGPDAYVRRSRYSNRGVAEHPHDLGYYVEVVPCRERDCADDE